jgi:hypothetical protein
LLRYFYGIWAASITQNALKKGDAVIIPVNETKTMKVLLTSWISSTIETLNESKQAKIVHCWRKTGLLEAFEATPAEKTELLAEVMSRKLELFPNLNKHDETGEVNSEDDMESAEMIGDVSALIVGDDGSVRKIAADEAEVDSAEQDAFISAQILLSEEGLNAADAVSNDGRDVDGDKECADDGAAAGEKKNRFMIFTCSARSNLIGR